MRQFRKLPNRFARAARCICEHLESRTLLTTLMISGTSGNDNITLDVTGGGFIKANVNGVETDYNPASYSDVSVQGAGGSDSLSIRATVLPTRILSDGTDTILIGNEINGVQGISSPLTVTSSSAETPYDLTVDDSADNAGKTFTYNGANFTDLAPATINTDENYNGFTFNGGGGGNHVTISGTDPGLVSQWNSGAGTDFTTIAGVGSGSTLNIDGGGGTDVVTVGSAGSVQSILGIVNITNGPAFSRLAIDDSADATARNATLNSFTPLGDSTYGTVTGLCPGTINYRFSDISSPITINGGSGGNTFNINGMAPSDTTVINTGSASATLNLHSTATTSTLAVNSQGANDTFNLDFTNGNPLPKQVNLNGLFSIYGLSATNNLNGTTMNIGRSQVYFNYGGAQSDPMALILSYLQTGYHNGAWNGIAAPNGGAINSAPAAANGARTTGIGYADSADGLSVNPLANSIELRYTLYGDTTLTGSVGFNDFTRLTQHYNQTTGGAWDTGDFNYDGSVNLSDFTLMTRTYSTTLGNQSAPAAPAAASSANGDQSIMPTVQVKPLASGGKTNASARQRKHKR